MPAEAPDIKAANETRPLNEKPASTVPIPKVEAVLGSTVNVPVVVDVPFLTTVTFRAEWDACIYVEVAVGAV